MSGESSPAATATMASSRRASPGSICPGLECRRAPCRCKAAATRSASWKRSPISTAGGRRAEGCVTIAGGELLFDGRQQKVASFDTVGCLRFPAAAGRGRTIRSPGPSRLDRRGGSPARTPHAQRAHTLRHRGRHDATDRELASNRRPGSSERPTSQGTRGLPPRAASADRGTRKRQRRLPRHAGDNSHGLAQARRAWCRSMRSGAVHQRWRRSPPLSSTVRASRGIDPHRPFDVLQNLFAGVLERDVQAVADVSGLTRDRMPPGWAILSSRAATLTPSPIDVVAFDDDVAQIDADAEFDPPLVGTSHCARPYPAASRRRRRPRSRRSGTRPACRRR